MTTTDQFDHVRDGWERSAQQREPDALYDVHRESTPATFGQSGATFAARTLAALPPAHYPTILELGAGPGRVTRWLQDHYQHIYAADIAPSMVQWLQRLKTEGHIADNVTPIESNGTDLDDRIPAPLDGVYTSLVLMHNPTPAVYAIFEALHDQLHPDHGRIAFQLPVYDRHIEPTKWNYVAQWTRDEVLELADATGYTPRLIYTNPGTYNASRKAETIGPNHFDLHIFDVQ